MSTPPVSLLTCCHLVTLPVRYAVGRYFNVPTAAILAFNLGDIGLQMAGRTPIHWFFDRRDDVQLPANFGHILGVFFRIIGCVSGIYTAAYLHRPIPRNVAILSTLAGYIAVHLAMVITKIVYERCYPIPVYELIHVSEETINGDE